MVRDNIWNFTLSPKEAAKFLNWAVCPQRPGIIIAKHHAPWFFTSLPLTTTSAACGSRIRAYKGLECLNLTETIHLHLWEPLFALSRYRPWLLGGNGFYNYEPTRICLRCLIKIFLCCYLQITNGSMSLVSKVSSVLAFSSSD